MNLKVKLITYNCDFPQSISARRWYKGILVDTMLIKDVPCGVVLTNEDEFDTVPLNLLESDYVSAAV